MSNIFLYCFAGGVGLSWGWLDWVELGWLWLAGFCSWLACCSSRCCLSACLNGFIVVIFLMFEFHTLVLRSVMCDMWWVGSLVPDGCAGM